MAAPGSRGFALLRPFQKPEWAARLKAPAQRCELAHTPTPIQSWRLPGVSEDKFSISIKRDDMTGCLLSGNKVRKLEFLAADALEKGCDTLISCGGTQSNHCRSVAATAAKLGMKCALVLRSDSQNPEDVPATGNLLLDMLLGSDCYLVPKVNFAGKNGLLSKMQALAKRLEDQGQKPYLIPVGGSNSIGLWGYIRAFEELMEQGLGTRFDDLVMTCGSGGTACGLAVANWLAGSPVKCHAITVCDSEHYFYKHIDEILVEVGITEVKGRDIIRIVDGYKGRGYALSSDHELEFIAEVAQDTGILLDPVYTGKSAYGLCEELKARPEGFAGNRILYLHTGGVYGVFAGALTAANGRGAVHAEPEWFYEQD